MLSNPYLVTIHLIIKIHPTVLVNLSSLRSIWSSTPFCLLFSGILPTVLILISPSRPSSLHYFLQSPKVVRIRNLGHCWIACTSLSNRPRIRNRSKASVIQRYTLVLFLAPVLHLKKKKSFILHHFNALLSEAVDQCLGTALPALVPSSSRIDHILLTSEVSK